MGVDITDGDDDLGFDSDSAVSGWYFNCFAAHSVLIVLEAEYLGTW